MSAMTSYAQNLEDVLLARALHDVKHGFYIDVGAWHPELDSVTRHFYDKGWCGVNVEPLSSSLKLFLDQRQRDINLCVAIADHAGTLPFYEVPDTGLSSLFREQAEAMARERGTTILEHHVPTITLNDLCSSCCSTTEFHFLKIDVEGSESAVIAGGDWDRFRPWIVLVEATRPNSQEPQWHVWEPDLLTAGYDFVWFDGLNRFYVRRESPELKGRFGTPPNVFDDYVPLSVVRLQFELTRSQASLTTAETQVHNLEAELDRLRGEVTSLRAIADVARTLFDSDPPATKP